MRTKEKSRNGLEEENRDGKEARGGYVLKKEDKLIWECILGQPVSWDIGRHSFKSSKGAWEFEFVAMWQKPLFYLWGRKEERKEFYNNVTTDTSRTCDSQEATGQNHSDSSYDS